MVLIKYIQILVPKLRSAELDNHVKIFGKLCGTIQDNSIDLFRQVLSEEATRNWLRWGGLDREGIRDEEWELYK